MSGGGSAAKNAAHLTVVHVVVRMDHPYWQGDGQDDFIAVQALEDALAPFSYDIVDIECAASAAPPTPPETLSVGVGDGHE